MAAEFGFADGFVWYDDQAAAGAGALLPALPRDGRPNEVKGAALFDRAITFIDTLGGNPKPLFLFAHTYSVHDYYDVHPWAADAVPDEDRPPRHYLACLNGWRVCRPSEWAELQALYRAELRHLDRGLERLLAALERAGRAQRTLLVFLSDHGEGFDVARGRVHHGGRLHEDQLRVPLMIRGPGIRPGEVEEAISLVDLMPTLLDRLGLAVPAGLDGRSLAPLLRGEPGGPPRPMYAMEHYIFWEDGQRVLPKEVRRTPLALAVIDGRDWYIRNKDGEELYDMADDPRQRRNLTPASARLAALRRLASSRRYQPPIADRPVDSEIDEQLRSLGYLD